MPNQMKKKLFHIIFLGFIFIVIFAFNNSWQKHKLDGFSGWIFSLFFSEDTVFAKGYNDAAFRKIYIGMKKEQVINFLGKPITEGWEYKEFCKCDLAMVWFENDIIIDYSLQPQKESDKIKIKMHKNEVIKQIGMPIREFWFYSKSPGSKSYSERIIKFEKEKVIEVNGCPICECLPGQVVHCGDKICKPGQKCVQVSCIRAPCPPVCM